LRPWGVEPHSPKAVSLQEKYPYPFTTDPVKSPANIRETANGIEILHANEVIGIAAHDSRFAQAVEMPQVSWGKKRQRHWRLMVEVTAACATQRS